MGVQRYTCREWGIEMAKMKSLMAGAMALAVLAAAGAANAATYVYSLSPDLGNGDYGTVDVTGTSTDLHFVIDLGANKLMDSGAHELFSGLLGGSNFHLTAPGGSGITLSTSNSDGISTPPFTGFDIALNCTTNCGSGGNNVYGSTLTFDITGANLSVEQAGTMGGKAYYFASDVMTKSGATGAVGATLSNAVPEPATWAMMITGVFAVGAMLRRRRVAVFA